MEEPKSGQKRYGRQREASAVADGRSAAPNTLNAGFKF